MSLNCDRRMTQFSPSYQQQRFFSLKDDPTGISEELASLMRKSMSADLCLVEVFEPISKSSIVFSCESTMTPQFSTEVPFKQFQIMRWTPTSHGALWTGNKDLKLGVFMEEQLSLRLSSSPPQWRMLHEKLRMQSVLTCPLACTLFQGQNQQLLVWGSVTLAHRNPRFFQSTDNLLYSNLTRLLKDFLSIAPVKLMRDLAGLVQRLSQGLSLKNQTHVLQQFLTSYTPAISASFAVFDNAYQSAAFFIDPNNAKEKQKQDFKKEAFLLKENTAVWNTVFCGENHGIPVNLESPFSFRHTDLDLIHQNKNQDSKFLWILPIRGVPVQRSEVQRVSIGAGPPVLGLSVKINGRGQNRWTGYLGAVYFHAKSKSDFSESDQKSMLALIKILYPILEKTLKRGEIKHPEDHSKSTKSVSDMRAAPGTTLSLGKDFMDQLKTVKERNRKKAQTQDEDLYKLKIDSLLDKASANSVVLQGRYSNSNSAAAAIKVIPGGQSKNQNFKIGLEHSILSSVNHPNIVRLLDSMLEVSGARLLNTCCEDFNRTQVESWLTSKWPGLGSIKSSNWTLLVMEYCDGGSLETMIHTRKKFDSSQVSCNRRDLLLTLLDISKAMEYLHNQGIVHGDLKPANILIKNSASDPREWKCCIADFGSSLRKDCVSRTSFSRHGCTVAYRAPEIMYSHGLAAHSHVQERCCADVYAFGMILYEMIEGCRPFEGESGDSIASKVCERKRPSMRRSKHCLKEVRQLLDECWAHDPKRRPTFGQISNTLTQLLNLEVGEGVH